MEIDHGGREIVAQIPPFFYLYKDGSASRPTLDPLVPASQQPIDGVASKDVVLDAALGLWARIFLPQAPAHDLDPSALDKLPVVLYIHGGGFIFGSPSWSNFHAFCSDMAARSNSIWVSASYRLAPEHQLPAAFDDCFNALCWLHSQSLLQAVGADALDSWLIRADFSRCFIAGESAGGNIVHHVAIRATQKVCWDPLCIQGLILIHPGFVREVRTQSEIDCAQDMLMNWDAGDTCFRLALPTGANRDHPFSNPLGPQSPPLKDVLFPPILVALADRDGLHYLGMEYCEALRKAGHSVEVVMSEGVGHVFFIRQPESEQAERLMQSLTSFIRQPHSS